MVMLSEQIVTIFSLLEVYFTFLHSEYKSFSNYMHDLGDGVIRSYISMQ